MGNVAQSLVFCVLFCRSLFGRCIVWPFLIYHFDNPFGIFKLFIHVPWFALQMLNQTHLHVPRFPLQILNTYTNVMYFGFLLKYQTHIHVLWFPVQILSQTYMYLDSFLDNRWPNICTLVSAKISLRLVMVLSSIYLHCNFGIGLQIFVFYYWVIVV